MSRSWRNDDRGLSNVVGALLLLAMGVTVFGTVRVAYTPIVTHDEEAQHMRLVARQFATLKADLDSHVLRDTSFPASHAFTLGREDSASMSEPDPPDRLRLAQSKRVTATAATFVRLGDAAGEVWTPLAGATPIADVAALLNLRLRVQQISAAEIGGHATIEFWDGQTPSQKAATFRVAVVPSGGAGFYYDLETLSATDDQEFRRRHAVLAGDTVQPVWADALAYEFRLDKTLSAAVRPLELRFSQTLLISEFTFHYAAHTEGGALIAAGGAGAPQADYELDRAGGTFSYESDNQRFVDQRLVLEHGAFILAQGEQAVFRSPPVVSAASTAIIAMIELAAPILEGPDSTAQGLRTLTTSASRLDRDVDAIAAPQLTLRIESDFPLLWRDLWAKRLDAAGLSDQGPDPEYALTIDATALTLQLNGPSTDPNVYDVRAQFTLARVRLDIRS